MSAGIFEIGFSDRLSERGVAFGLLHHKDCEASAVWGSGVLALVADTRVNKG